MCLLIMRIGKLLGFPATSQCILLFIKEVGEHRERVWNRWDAESSSRGVEDFSRRWERYFNFAVLIRLIRLSVFR